MSIPDVGDLAPDFELAAYPEGWIKLSNLRGCAVALFFYPKDFTSVCTKEACGFRDAFSELRAAGIEVLGVSRDSIESHKKFAETHRLPYRLLSDPDGAVHAQYGAAPSLFGMLPKRATFAIDKTGIIRKVVRSLLDADQHVAAVLAALR